MGLADTLLSGFTIKSMTLRNRIVSTAHAPGYAENGLPGARYQAYHEAKARGGIGMTMIGGSSIISAEVSPIYNQLDVSRDAIIPKFRELSARVHAHGTRIMCQISHMGRRTAGDDGNWITPIAPSSVRDPAHHAVPRAMEREDIDRIVQAYAAAANRCSEGGLDGCEILVSSHLPGQFLDASANRRNDDYGGTLANRMRFLREVLAAVRNAVPETFVVSLRMAINEADEGGPDEQECLSVARELRSLGLYDLLNLIGTSGATTLGLSGIIGSMASPIGGWVDRIRDFRSKVDAPVLHAARITDLSTAAHAIFSGAVDLVGMTRAHFADPDIVAKLAAGKPDTIRPCVGTSFCIDRIYAGRASLCAHNPATGREETLPHRLSPTTGPSRKVVVVGGGPAGMEAARVAAARGHTVVLFEAANRLGGQLILASMTGMRRDMIGIADWLAGELERLGVDVRLQVFADPETIRAERPDVVVLATGGTPRSPDIVGADLAMSTWDVIASPPRSLASVLVYDEDGGHGAMSVTGMLAAAGMDIDLAVPDRMVGRNIGGSTYPVYLRRFADANVRMIPNRKLAGIRRHENRIVATLRHEYGAADIDVTTDAVICELGTIPDDTLFDALKPDAINSGITDLDALISNKPQPCLDELDGAGRAGFALFRIGDAEASADVHAAILGALRLMKDL